MLLEQKYVMLERNLILDYGISLSTDSWPVGLTFRLDFRSGLNLGPARWP